MNGEELLEELCQTIHDSVRAHTGRSIGDSAAKRVAQDVYDLLDALWLAPPTDDEAAP